MHHQSSQNHECSSTEVPAGEAPATSNPGGIAQCPPLIRDFATEICRHCSAQPEAVVATMFAVIAAALGPNVRLNGKAARLNVVVAHDAPRRLPWFDIIAAPLLNFALTLQARLGGRGSQGIKADIAAKQRELTAARRSVNPSAELLKSAEERLVYEQCALDPLIVIGRLSPKDLIQAVAGAFDLGVTVSTMVVDAGDAFLQLRPPERATVAGLLNSTWQEQPLVSGTRTQPGRVALLIQTRRQLAEMLGRAGLGSGLLNPPVLGFEEKHRLGTVFPRLPAEVRWDTVIGTYLRTRCLKQLIEFRLTEDAAKVFHCYAEECAASLATLPLRLQPYLDWVGDLAPSIGLIMWILESHDDVVVDAEAATRAIATTRWLAHAHRQHVSAALADSADETDKAAKMLAKIRLRAPMSKRELWRSYDRPQTSWFEPALQALLNGKKVAYDEQDRLVPAK